MLSTPTGQHWVLGALVGSAFLTGRTARGLLTEAFADRSGDCFPLVFQALLQKRSTSVITTWLSSPLRHGREDGEDCHALRARASSRPRRQQRPGRAGSCCPRPLRVPGVGRAVRCGHGATAWPCSAAELPSPRHGGALPGTARTHRGCSVFLCTSRLQVFELSVQFVRIFAYRHPCCFEVTVFVGFFLNAQFH